MDVSEAIQTRRSIRRYKPDPVPREALNTILGAVQWAPSWGNTQCWEVIAVRDTNLRKRLDETLPKKNSARRSLVEAPVCLAVCGRDAVSGYYNGEASTRYGEWTLFDCALAVQNLSLVAHSLGLGTVIIGQFDHEAAEKLLGIPEGHSLVCLVPLGYPAKISKAPKRKSVSEFTFHEQFGQQGQNQN